MIHMKKYAALVLLGIFINSRADTPTGYRDGRPAAALRLEAKDYGIVLKHGDGPDSCEIYGARDVWVFEHEGTYYMHYDGAGAKGWLCALATSKDLIHWDKKGPVLDFGKPGSDDSKSASYGTTFFDGKVWHMFYLGTPNTSKPPDRVPSFPYLTMKATSSSPAGPWMKQYDVIPFRPQPETYYSATASPGHIVKNSGEYLQFFSASIVDNGIKRTLGIARTKNLNGQWQIDPEPIVPLDEQIENSSLYFEETNQTWFLFTNHVGINAHEYTDAIWVYWSKDINKWNPKNKAVVLDSCNCTWSKKVIGLPSVLRVGDKLAIFYDGLHEEGISHMRRDIGLAWLELPLIPPSLQKVQKFLKKDVGGKIQFFGSNEAKLFTREIDESFRAVVSKNYQTDYDEFMPGYITASVDGRPWYDTMWSRDGGTFLRELVLWGYLNHACLLADCLIQLVEKNDAGYFTFPEYFKYVQPASGKEWDGTASIIIGMSLLWQRLQDKDPYKQKIYDFLHQYSCPLRYIHQKLQTQPLVEGSGEFGGGCGIKGEWYNVVQNNLVRLALIAEAEMEKTAGDQPLADLYVQDAERIDKNMLKYLVDADSSWIWCIDPQTLASDSAIIFHPINKGFGGLNGVASTYADVLGLEPLASDWPGAEISKNTFEQLYAFPLRKEQFDKYGIWTQFDEFRQGMSSGPSYGDGYALQTMLLLDKMEMADKSLKWLANATYQPVSEYTELDRDSPYYFYERYYSPDIVGKMKLEQGCGALNLVNVTEPLKVARLIVGVDDYSSDEVKIIPRVPPSWSGFRVKDWPIFTQNAVVRANMEFEKSSGRATFKISVLSNKVIHKLAIRFQTKHGTVWHRRQDVSKVEISADHTFQNKSLFGSPK